jgi:hypothetical protein
METINHLTRAQGHLLNQYQDAANLSSIIATFAGQTQELENALQEFFTKRSLAVATGAQLDVLGEILGMERGSYADATYRALLYLRVAQYNSEGTIEELIGIYKNIMGSSYVFFQELFPASFSMMAINPAPIASPAEVFKIITNAKAAGIGNELLAAVYPAFAFLDDPIGTTGGFGGTWQMDGITGAGILASYLGNPYADQTPEPDIYEEWNYPGYPSTMLSPSDPNKFTLRNGEFDEGFYVYLIANNNRIFISSFTELSAASWNRPELVGHNDYDLRFRVVDTNGWGILLRYSSGGGYYLKINPGQKTMLYKFTGWTPSKTNVVSAGAIPAAAGLDRVHIRVEGNRIKAWVKNTAGFAKIMDASDPDHPTGGIGVTSEYTYIEQQIGKLQINLI